MSGVRLKDLDSDDMIDVLAHIHVEEQLHDREYQEVRDKARAEILRQFRGSNFDDVVEYSSTEISGTNDYSPYGPQSDLPPVTAQTDDGYIGLDAPMQ